MRETRREFLKKSGGCALGMVALATQMHHLGAISAMAQKVIDSGGGEGGQNYKALVCLYMSGGNDGNNMVIPNHLDGTVSNFNAYFNARNPQGLYREWPLFRRPRRRTRCIRVSGVIPQHSPPTAPPL
jgi:hypothetical protein